MLKLFYMDTHAKKKPLLLLIVSYCLLALLLIAYFTILTISYYDYLWHNMLRYIVYIFSFPLLSFVLSPVIFFILWFNKKKSILTTKRVWLGLVISALLPLTGVVTARIIIKANYNKFYTFTSEKWQQSNVEDRLRLIPSFEKKHTIIGKPLTYTISLLGDPDHLGDTNCHYYLGFGRGFAIDSHLYFVTFDANSIVTNAYIVQT